MHHDVPWEPLQAEDWTNCAPKTLDLSNFTGSSMGRVHIRAAGPPSASSPLRIACDV